ncbi:ABC transporter substrate-binding protein [Arenibaculum sp.]|jgi:peptide/nickel transport system substrate-binding protein|uniref:ABC transporter substrate-binding protein n=1 Tax=Arenibaculum sp. TaxID=2865862 RepID=UPI002E1560F6|nr:ABC transporter substrate-binding protein [Arenibaculum sp.]
MRLLLWSTLAGVLAAGTAFGALAAEPVKGGAINVATIGEPPTLDPSASTADIVGLIAQHYYETLYTFGQDWKIVPLLAAEAPTISQDGTQYVIGLREGVKFHDGSTMDADDVVASLKRWMDVAVRGKQAAAYVTEVTAVDPLTVRIVLSEPYAPLMGLLSLATSAAIVMPADKAAAGTAEQAGDPVGTGPYRFQERQPDRYILLTRFEDYTAREDAADLYGGRRTAHLDEIRFVPVPNANTRVEGALGGQYHYADALPVEAYGTLDGQPGVEPAVVEPFGWPVMFFNTREGALTDPALRRAVLASLNFSDMLEAAFGSGEFYAVDGSLYPEGFIWHTEAGTAAHDQGDPAKAAEMAQAAGYDGKPIRILTSMQYEFHYKMALVAAEYMKQAGFQVDLQVSDWATLTQRRGEPGLWEIYFTHSPFLPEPALNSFLNNEAPGWWATPEKDALVAALNTQSDPAARAAIWADFQELVYEQVPIAKVGNFNALGARSTRLAGFQPSPWPFFWNTWIESD